MSGAIRGRVVCGVAFGARSSRSRTLSSGRPLPPLSVADIAAVAESWARVARGALRRLGQ